MKKIIFLLFFALYAHASEITFHAATIIDAKKAESTETPYIDETNYKLSSALFFAPSEILECRVEPSYKKDSVIVSPPCVTTHLMRLKITPDAARKYNAFMENRSHSIVVASSDEKIPILRLYFTEETGQQVLRIAEDTGLLVVRFNMGYRGYTWYADDQK